VDEGLSIPALGHGPLSVKWLGTAGFEVRHGDTRILIDPYFTRASLPRLALGRLAADAAAITRHVERADAVVVGHTHFDHVLDVPAIARLTGATVFGSRSAATLCAADGVPRSRIVDVEGALRNGTFTAEVGPFELRFFPSAHSKLLFGRRVPMPGEIADCDQVPNRMSGYKCGAVFACELRVAGKSVFHLGSAELVESSLPRSEVDLLLFCAAGWKSTPRVVERAVSRLSPRAVLLSHWDDFFRPLEKGARVLPALALPALVDRFRRETRDAKVGIVQPLSHVRL
jgi:L-ascorbate metabolism protein UlaG (beta-lactamase superfamily)